MRGPSMREQENQQLVVHLQRIHAQSGENYGLLKAWKVLQAEGVACGRNRVANLRSVHNLYARRRRRFVVTTRSRQTPGIAPNHLNRQFEVAQPNRVWVSDVTFIATRKGWLFLAVLLDLFAQSDRLVDVAEQQP